MKKFDINAKPGTHNPFVVPNGYFDVLAASVMMRVSALDAAAARQNSWIGWIPWLGAACVASLVVLFSQVVPTTADASQTAAPAAVQHVSANTNADAAYDCIMMADADNLAAYENDY